MLISCNPRSLISYPQKSVYSCVFAKIAEFRTLNDKKGMAILSNIRPVKGKRERNVFHVCPSGSTYASLLPIPRNLSPSRTEENGNAKNVIAV